MLCGKVLLTKLFNLALLQDSASEVGITVPAHQLMGEQH